MSEEQTPAPSAPAESVAPVVSPAPVAPPIQDGDPAWLPKRLEQAKNSAIADALKLAGFSSIEDAQAAAAELKAIKEAALSDHERAQRERDELKTKADRAAALEQSVNLYATRELSALTETQQAAVKALAGDDPARVLTTIEQLRPTWAALPVAPVAPVPPVTTAPPHGPPSSGHTSPVDYRAEYTRLKSINPFAAADLLARHSAEIFAANQ